MPTLFEGEPDARQSEETQLLTTMFRPRYRALTSDEILVHDKIKETAATLLGVIMLTKAGRYRSLAITSLEQSVMWAVKGLTE